MATIHPGVDMIPHSQMSSVQNPSMIPTGLSRTAFSPFLAYYNPQWRLASIIPNDQPTGVERSHSDGIQALQAFLAKFSDCVSGVKARAVAGAPSSSSRLPPWPRAVAKALAARCCWVLGRWKPPKTMGFPMVFPHERDGYLEGIAYFSDTAIWLYGCCGSLYCLYRLYFLW